MARKCKCKKCKQELTTDKAYKVIINGKNQYYCNKEEYDNIIKEKEARQHCLEEIASYMRLKFATPFIQKEVNKLKEYYDYIVIERSFKDNEKSINWFLDNNENSSEFGKCRYVFTIISNNINNTYNKYKKELSDMKAMFKQDDTVDIEIMNMDNKQSKREVSDISQFLD